MTIVNKARIRQNIPEFRMIHVSIKFHLKDPRYGLESFKKVNKARIRQNMPEFRMIRISIEFHLKYKDVYKDVLSYRA